MTAVILGYVGIAIGWAVVFGLCYVQATQADAENEARYGPRLLDGKPSTRSQDVFTERRKAQ